MILFYREDQSVARVAEALEISEANVKQRLSRGRKFLQEQLAVTVAKTLEKSKPSKAFTAAVILGFSGAKAKTATAGGVASVAAKAAMPGTGFGGMFLMSIAKLPLIAWLFKVVLDESRSPQERQLTVQQLLFWMLGIIPMMAIMFGTIPLHDRVQSPVLRGSIIPGIMVLYMIPMIFSFRRFGKRIEQLRIEEETATPLRAITLDQEHGGSVTRLFVGSGLLIAFWPSMMAFVASDWISVGSLLMSAVVISLTGVYFSGKQPVRAFRTFACSLGGIGLIGIGLVYFRRVAWADSFSNHMLWFAGTLQAMAITNVMLATVVWRRVYGKPQ